MEEVCQNGDDSPWGSLLVAAAVTKVVANGVSSP